jgi:hypothetical protein
MTGFRSLGGCVPLKTEVIPSYESPCSEFDKRVGLFFLCDFFAGVCWLPWPSRRKLFSRFARFKLVSPEHKETHTLLWYNVVERSGLSREFR